jgi:flagellar basal-body rod protein FlgG
MLRAMSTAASGMEAQELKIDLIANNLANVNTAGFKKVRGEFQDLLYDKVRVPGAPDQQGNAPPTGLEIGQGVRPVATLRQFSMGDLKQTGNPLDLAIEGIGFFQVTRPDGQPAYTRDGSFKTDANGRVVNADGLPVEPPLTLPVDTREVVVNADGTVAVKQAQSTDFVEIGRIELATFANPAGLDPLGRNLFAASSASGVSLLGQPGGDGLGSVAQGALEMSNVKVVEEMIELIATQRAYETNSRVIQAADEMLRASSNLR